LTGPMLLYDALQEYEAAYPDLDGVTILEPNLMYPFSWTDPRLGEDLNLKFKS